MPYRLQRDEPVTDGVVRITREQAELALAEIEDPQLDEHRSLHRVRARCHELRALYCLVGAAAPDLYEREDRGYRDLARSLSELGDADVHLDAYDLVQRHVRGSVGDGATEVIRETLEERRDELADELGVDERLALAHEQLLRTRERSGSVRIDADGFDALAGGLGRTYGAARDGFTDAYERATSHAFRQWHEQVTTHAHHVRLLQDVWPEVLEGRRDELHDLTDVTGDERALAELRATLLTEPENFPDEQVVEAFVALLDRERARLQREAEPLGAGLFAEDPDTFVHRVRVAWDGWWAGPAAERATTRPAVPPDE